MYILTVFRQSSLFLFFLFMVFPVPGWTQGRPTPIRLKNSPTLTVTEMGSWQPVHKGTEYRRVTLQRIQPRYLISFKMVRFDTHWVVPHIVRSRQYKLHVANVKTLAEKSGAMVAINANYFDENGKALGFLKAASHSINDRISKSSLFTGIFGTKNRVPFIIHRDDFSPDQADEGLQAGPLLLTKGTALSVRRGAHRHTRRSLIGMDRERRLIVAVTDGLVGGLSWVEIQEFFASRSWQVGVTDLLNLDGGGSAQLYIKGGDLEEYVPGTTDVPVAVGFFPKAE